MTVKKEKAAYIKNKRRLSDNLSEKLTGVACGFLLTRGIAGGAVAVHWSMYELLGSDAGWLYGVLIFPLGGALVCMIRQNFGERGSAAADWMVFALYAMWRFLSDDTAQIIPYMAEGALVIASLLLTGGRRTGLIRMVLPVILMPLVWLLPVPSDTAVHRLTALCGCLASAGMFGAGISAVCTNKPGQWPWIIAGAAVGLL